MINLVKSELFLLKKMSFAVTACFVVAMVAVFFGGMDVEKGVAFTVTALAKGSAVGILLSTFVVGGAIAYGYLTRLQLYEIMVGYKPSVIILSRVALFIPLVILAYLLPVGVVLFIVKPSTEMVQTYFLFCFLCLRLCLCTIFLSPFFKEGAWITLFSAMVLMIKEFIYKPTGSTDSFRHSVFGLTTFGQSALLAEPITRGFVLKVILSGVVSCVLCYLAGYYVLKKKVSLEVSATL